MKNKDITDFVKNLLQIAYNEGYNNTKSPQFDKWIKKAITDLEIKLQSNTKLKSF